jgi:hypothetical protein
VLRHNATARKKIRIQGCPASFLAGLATPHWKFRKEFIPKKFAMAHLQAGATVCVFLGGQ